jgi:hypothetical protein
LAHIFFPSLNTMLPQESPSSRHADHVALQDVLSKIQKEWATMTDADCIPVQVALQLMDSSSLGRAHQADQFRDIYQNLQEALKAVVKGTRLSPLPDRGCDAKCEVRTP